jgi:HPt (histidine-containing phosphotransfer) domain-containing protein
LPPLKICCFAVQSWRLFDKTASDRWPYAKRSVNQFHVWLREIRGRIVRRPDIWVIIMPLHLERINWMPSPPLAPDDGPIDLVHLQRMTLGDDSLEREVLAMFAGQAVGLMERLVKLPSDVAELAHTLKGSARAIGAFRVADAAEWLETAVREDSDTTEALMTLNDAVAEARLAIDRRLNRS